MMCSDNDSLAFIKSIHNDPYNSSLASSASSSSASVWSDASSQHSDDTSISAVTSDTESSGAYCFGSQAPHTSCDQGNAAGLWAEQASQTSVEVPQELRQNPRRTSGATISRTGCPPTLVRQSNRKVNFVDNLVGKL
jgi:hypothetical protein